MGAFLTVSDADLARARHDAAFRQRLLTQSLDALLTGMKQGRGAAGATAKQLREGVELAVRLAELIQNAAPGMRP